MTPREADAAEARATRLAPCPECGTDTWWPVDTASLEATCSCSAVLRLEPCGCVRCVGWAGEDESEIDLTEV
jgi:hypothetical protein